MSYRIFGISDSPYSVKVRSYARYKKIPHEWIVRNQSNMEEFQKYAKLPIVPLVVTPDNKGVQDSTPIMEALDQVFHDPSIHPPSPVCKFLSQLLEEFGDEWLNKYMFHYRWAREIDQDVVSKRLASEMFDMPVEQAEQFAAAIKQRMSGRGFAVGSNEKTADLIEEWFKQGLDLFEAHLKTRSFLFGARPSYADFGMAPQLYQALIDPTAGEIMRARCPSVVRWAERMCDTPVAEGDFEEYESLKATLEPILLKQVTLFLQWTEANSHAISNKEKEMTVEINGKTWWQTIGGPQKYQAKSLKEIRQKFAQVQDDSVLVDILQRCQCLDVLANNVAKL